MAVLDAGAMEFWKENGYVVAPRAVPPENCREAERAVWAFLGMDSEDAETWYPDPPRPGIMVEMYQHQALWNNRQHPRVHRAFADVWGTEKLWVSFDRTSLNPPERPGFAFKGPYLHWDISLDDPSRFMVQGVLYLSDTAANQGAFTCVPGFHRRIAEWLETLSDEDDPRTRMQAEFGHLATPIAGREGDLVIWNSLLPHGSSPNSAERPRIVQYITMTPARDDDESHRQSRIEGWRERLTGLGKNRKEKEHLEGETARLTPLGRKLLGVDRW